MKLSHCDALRASISYTNGRKVRTEHHFAHLKHDLEIHAMEPDKAVTDNTVTFDDDEEDELSFNVPLDSVLNLLDEDDGGIHVFTNESLTCAQTVPPISQNEPQEVKSPAVKREGKKKKAAVRKPANSKPKSTEVPVSNSKENSAQDQLTDVVHENKPKGRKRKKCASNVADKIFICKECVVRLERIDLSKYLSGTKYLATPLSDRGVEVPKKVVKVEPKKTLVKKIAKKPPAVKKPKKVSTKSTFPSNDSAGRNKKPKLKKEPDISVVDISDEIQICSETVSNDVEKSCDNFEIGDVLSPKEDLISDTRKENGDDKTSDIDEDKELFDMVTDDVCVTAETSSKKESINSSENLPKNVIVDVISSTNNGKKTLGVAENTKKTRRKNGKLGKVTKTKFKKVLELTDNLEDVFKTVCAIVENVCALTETDNSVCGSGKEHCATVSPVPEPELTQFEICFEIVRKLVSDACCLVPREDDFEDIGEVLPGKEAVESEPEVQKNSELVNNEHLDSEEKENVVQRLNGEDEDHTKSNIAFDGLDLLAKLENELCVNSKNEPVLILGVVPNSLDLKSDDDVVRPVDPEVRVPFQDADVLPNIETSCDSKSENSSTKPVRSKYWWYVPVTNLTKSERRLRKIKRCSGMSPAFWRNVKALMKRHLQLLLIEAVQLSKLSEQEIVKWSKVQIRNGGLISIQPKKTSDSVPKLAERLKQLSRPPQIVRTPSFNRETFQPHKNQKKKSRMSNHSADMEKKERELANRISKLPRIPKKTTQSDVNLTPKAEEDVNKMKEKEAASSEKLSRVKLKSSKSRSENQTSKRVMYGDKNEWYNSDLDEFTKCGRKKGQFLNINCNDNKGYESIEKLLNDVLPLHPSASVVQQAEKNLDARTDSQSDKLTSKADGTDENTYFQEDDNLQLDDGFSLQALSDDFVYLEDGDPKTETTNKNYQSPKTSSDFTSQLRPTICRKELWDYSSDDSFGDMNESEWENSEVFNCEVATTKRESFELELKTMSHDDLETKLKFLVPSENLPKCLVLFEYLEKTTTGILPMVNLKRLFVIARKNVNCFPDIIVKFTKTIIRHVKQRSNVAEKIKLVSDLLAWFIELEIQGDDQLIKTNCKFSINLLSRILNGELYDLVDQYNKVLEEALTSNSCEIIYLYRYGRELHLQLYFPVIRGLIITFAKNNLWTWCQELYKIGGSLSFYNKIKVRKFPLSVCIKYDYAEEEIKIVLYDCLVKLNTLIDVRYYNDVNVDNWESSIFIIFEVNMEPSVFNHIDCTLLDVYGKLNNVVSSMVGVKLGEMKVPSSTLTLGGVFVRGMLRHAKDWFSKHKLQPFNEYDKPGSYNRFAYRMLTTTGLYAHYDDNPFN